MCFQETFDGGFRFWKSVRLNMSPRHRVKSLQINILFTRNRFWKSMISFWEYSSIMNKHNQEPTDVLNKQDVIVYLTYIKILEVK